MKTLVLTFNEFNLINKILLTSGHKELSYDIIKRSGGDKDSLLISVPDIEDDEFDLIVKLLIINDDPIAIRLGYNLIDENIK